MCGGVLLVWVRVMGFFVSFVLIYLSQALIIARIARFLDFSEFIFLLFVLLWDITHAVFWQLLACKEPPCDGVEAQ
jgi:multisubunit Na+/H+ antiporter MnhE subunit